MGESLKEKKRARFVKVNRCICLSSCKMKFYHGASSIQRFWDSTLHDFLMMKAGCGIKVKNKILGTLVLHNLNKVFVVLFTLFPMLVRFLLNMCWRPASYGLKRQWTLEKQ
jgi:hypothetical protein